MAKEEICSGVASGLQGLTDDPYNVEGLRQHINRLIQALCISARRHSLEAFGNCQLVISVIILIMPDCTL